MGAAFKTVIGAFVTIFFLLIIANIGYTQKFPSCTNDESQKRTVALLTRWFEAQVLNGIRRDVRLLSIDIQRIWPRNARFGNFSGIVECEITANAILLKISTGQQFVLSQFKDFVVYYGYDQNGDLVVQTPSGFR